MRRAMNRKSSPACSIFASQYIAPFSSDARMLFMNALIESFDAERFKPKDLRARDERAVHIKERIVSGRANQAEISRFDIGQKNVLLRFVEMMDLIDEQDGLLSGGAEAIRRRGDDAAHLGNIAFHAADSNEFRVRDLRNDPGQRGLAGSRRPGKDH